MLYTKKFVFTVSLCAMLAANPVLAVTNPVEAKAGAFSGEVGKVGEVYSDWAGRAESGIAGVRYVNSAVDAAGNAAQWAENHAAAAAQSAKSAADSAAQAASKVAIAQGTGNENKAMVTDDKGSVYAGYISVGMVDSKEKSGKNNAFKGLAIVADGTGSVDWGQVSTTGIANGAVTTAKIADDAVTKDKIASSYINGSGNSLNAGLGMVLVADGNGGAEWGQVGNAGIADSAVTPDKIGNSGEYSGALVLNTSGVAEWGKIEPGWIDTSGYVSGVLVMNTSGVAEWGKVTPDKISVSGYTGALVTNASGEAEWGKIDPGWISADGATSTGWSSGFLVFDDNGDLSTYTGAANTIVGFDGSGKLYSYSGWGIFGSVSGSVPDFSLNPDVFGPTGVTSYTGKRVLTYDGGFMGWGKVLPTAINNAGFPGVMTFNASGDGEALSGDKGQVLISADGGRPTWGKIGPESTEGVVGMVPVGSADSNTYGQLWIE